MWIRGFDDFYLAHQQAKEKTICGSVFYWARTGLADFSSASRERPSTSTIFLREENPEAIRTARLGNPNSEARNSQSASLALPSVAGAWIRTFKSSPSQPTIPLFDAPGTTLTENFTKLYRFFAASCSQSFFSSASSDVGTVTATTA